jgi:hypothetical protein
MKPENEEKITILLNAETRVHKKLWLPAARKLRSVTAASSSTLSKATLLSRQLLGPFGQTVKFCAKLAVSSVK